MAYKVHFFTKNILKFLCILYAICRFEMPDSQQKLATQQLLA